MAKNIKTVSTTIKNLEFYKDITEKLIQKIQYALDNKTSLGLALGYGRGRPAVKGKKAKTIVRETLVVDPTNFSTEKEYSGSNYNKFRLAVALSNYETGWFGSYNQWNEAGCSIKAGSKALKGRKWMANGLTDNQIDENALAQKFGVEPLHEEKEPHTVFFNVYNLDQVEAKNPEGAELIKKLNETKKVVKGLHVINIPAVADVPASDYYGDAWYSIPALDNIDIGVKINISTSHKCGEYDIQKNVINMPNMVNGFRSSGHYYNTLLHEMVHATAKKLGRNIHPKMPLEELYNEELIAELAAWILTVEFGIWMEEDEKSTTPAYLAHYLKHLNQSGNYLRQIMAEVNRACHMIRHHVVKAQLQEE
jgi:antirestriction protein ArdC